MKQSKTVTKPDAATCWAHRHMNRTEYAVYDLCMAWSSRDEEDKLAQYKGMRVIFFNGPRMAAEFSEGDRSTVYRAADALEERGWLFEVRPTSYAGGRCSSRHFLVRTHAEWMAARHPETGQLYSDMYPCDQTRGALYSRQIQEESETPKWLKTLGDAEKAVSHIATAVSHETPPVSHIATAVSHIAIQPSHIAIQPSHQTARTCSEPVEITGEVTCAEHHEGTGGAPLGPGLSHISSTSSSSGGRYRDSEAPISSAVSHIATVQVLPESHIATRLPLGPKPPRPIVGASKEVQDFIDSVPEGKDRVQVSLWARKRMEYSKPPVPTTLQDIHQEFPQFVMEGVSA